MRRTPLQFKIRKITTKYGLDFKSYARKILITSYLADACHIGSSLSAIKPLLIIFSKIKKNDRFIFAKASGACAYYVLLSKMGYFPERKLFFYLKNYPLCDKRVPGVLFSVGSLGHGLPAAVGLALADKKRDVYVLMSDGELQCGMTWECLLFKKQHKLDNLKIYVDFNGLQACGAIKDILDLPWDFLKNNGVNLIKTVKGEGVSFMRNNFKWHYFNISEPQLKKALEELT